MTTNAFLTGSRAYGTPREDSDWDLCVLVAPELKERMEQAGLAKVGNLNLIMHDNEAEFGAWRRATENMIQRGLCTRDEAVKAIDYEKQLVGLSHGEGYSS